MAMATVAVALTVALLTVLAKPLLRISDPAFTSVGQGVIRWYGFVFLPVAGAVFGEEGLGTAAVAFGVLAPALNVVCLLALARWRAGQGGGWRLALTSLARNPIIWACGTGAALNLAGVPRPDLLMATLDLMGLGAIALGLMAGVVPLMTVVSAFTILILLAVFGYL
ncbi:AEC family transporter [Brevundimonas sp.]|uniref:AEC family transporter n=1 Tax=Brevundimonas sp. TaxID=1871086 RepID=UPI0035664824